MAKQGEPFEGEEGSSQANVGPNTLPCARALTPFQEGCDLLETADVHLVTFVEDEVGDSRLAQAVAFICDKKLSQVFHTVDVFNICFRNKSPHPHARTRCILFKRGGPHVPSGGSIHSSTAHVVCSM